VSLVPSISIPARITVNEAPDGDAVWARKLPAPNISEITKYKVIFFMEHPSAADRSLPQKQPRLQGTIFASSPHAIQHLSARSPCTVGVSLYEQRRRSFYCHNYAYCVWIGM
jgi:hypothetical protein